MDELFHRLTGLAESAIGSLKVRSALNPVLWLALITIPFGFAAAMISDSVAVKVVGLVIAAVPVFLFGLGFVYLMCKSPDKLRSEEFELKRMALSMIQEKGGPIVIGQVSVEAITNPDYRDPPKLTQDTDHSS